MTLRCSIYVELPSRSSSPRRRHTQVFYRIREFREASSITLLISDATLLENCPFKPTTFNASNVLESAFFKAPLNCASKPLFRQRGLSMTPVGNQGRYLL